MTPKIVFLFSGQGSQYRDMGRDLFDHHPVFRHSIETSDLHFRQHLNRSLIQELYQTDTADFEDVLITHPAIVAVEIAMLAVMESQGIIPDFVYGQSLGEFAASVASGIWSASTAIEAAIMQAKSLANAGLDGGMLSLVKADEHRIAESYKEYDLSLALDNFKGHFTVTGTKKSLDTYQKYLTEQGVLTARIPVTLPFHSTILQEHLHEFSTYLQQTVVLKKPNIPHISSLSILPITEIDATYYNRVISSYANHQHAIDFLESQGTCLYIDLGPSGTNATFVKYSLPTSSSSKIQAILSPYGKERKRLDTLQRLISKS